MVVFTLSLGAQKCAEVGGKPLASPYVTNTFHTCSITIHPARSFPFPSSFPSSLVPCDFCRIITRFQRGSSTTRQNDANLPCYNVAARVSSVGRIAWAKIRSAWLITSSDGSTTKCSSGIHLCGSCCLKQQG